MKSDSSGSIFGLRPGDIIDGRIEIVSLIGHGGQGVVLKVKHLEWDRELALKLPLPEVVHSPESRERFLQEAETWIRLGVHPNIVRCWFVQNIVGLPGMFLDLIPGGSLEDKIDNGELPPGHWSPILKALLQTSEGLVRAHSMGVIHRDIKPENLLIRANGQVCLTDFGLVKSLRSESESIDGALSDELGESTGLTQTGLFMGTPRYAAPEQWSAEWPTTAATDTYALGGILYELICGRRAFDGPGEEEINPLELVQRHMQKNAPDPREFRSDIPESLAALALSCLSKEPAKRPPSALHMVEILSGLLKEHAQEEYQRPAPVPGGDRADHLNNAAVSLYSLGKVEKSKELLRRGLLIEAGHPECVYNLVQLERRQGKMGAGESLQQLRRAQARYQLALLCIEEGLGKQAIELIDSLGESEQNGLTHRIRGDALMYAKTYLEAQRAYEKAQKFMPGDQPTRIRKVLASQGRREIDGHLFFPSPVSCYRNKAANPNLRLMLTDDSQNLVGVNAEEVVLMNVDSESTLGHALRPGNATPAKQTWIHGDRLMIQDSQALELWALGDMTLLQRIEGRLLAATRSLKRLVLLKRDGLTLLDKATGTVAPLCFPPGTQPSVYVRACFTPDERGLCLLTPEGRLAQVGEQYDVRSLAWPPAIPHIEELSCFQFGPNSVVYVATIRGEVHAFDMAVQKIKFFLQVPFAPEEIAVGGDGQTVVVSCADYWGIFGSSGELLAKGFGPCSVDQSGRFALAWGEGFLTLYELVGFRRIRSWAEKIERPVQIVFAKDGRRAASLGADGTHQVWEVDERNRVFERSLLLTPGQSYEELISSFDLYLASFQRAQTLFRKQDFLACSQALSQARGAPGFFQAEEALDLHWELTKRLQRGTLSATWERMFQSDVSGFDFSSDGRRLLLSRDCSWSLSGLGSSVGLPTVSASLASEILSCKLLEPTGNSSVVFSLCRDGLLYGHAAQDGVEILRTDVGLGPLVFAEFSSDSLLLLSSEGVVASMNLSTLSIINSAKVVADNIDSVSLMDATRVLVRSGQESSTLDLNTGALCSGLPFKAVDAFQTCTFVGLSSKPSLYRLGFSDGTTGFINTKGSEILFAVNHQAGPITELAFHPPTALGASASALGFLTLFDLASGEVFEQFQVHNEEIKALRLSRDGRYLATRSRSGQFRLLELSWQLTQNRGQPSVEWLNRGALGKLGKLFKRTINPS